MIKSSVFQYACSTWSSRHIFWTILILFAGLGLRGWHYGRNPPVWHDEAAVIINATDKGYAELVGPLRFDQATPPLFLFACRGLVTLGSDHIQLLRLLGFIPSVLSLFWFAALSRRVLPSPVANTALVLFAFSDALLWHTCEVKPYAFDVLLAVGLMYAVLATETWSLPRRCVTLALIAPVAILGSFPSIFMYCGLFAALLPVVIKTGGLKAWGAFVGLGVVVGSTFLLILLGVSRSQHTTGLDHYWSAYFPDWTRPQTVPIWFVESTLGVGSYCFRPVGFLLVPFVTVGIATRYQQSPRMVAAATIPLLAAVAASALHKYPYGASRLEVFALPGLALLAAAGLSDVWDRVIRSSVPKSSVLLVFLILTMPALAAYRAAFPWTRHDTKSAYLDVMAHRRGEPVAADMSPYEYYFRRVGIDMSWVTNDAQILPNAPQVWVVLSYHTPSQQSDLILLWEPKWRIVEHRTYTMTDVYLLAAR